MPGYGTVRPLDEHFERRGLCVTAEAVVYDGPVVPEFGDERVLVLGQHGGRHNQDEGRENPEGCRMHDGREACGIDLLAELVSHRFTLVSAVTSAIADRLGREA